MTDRRLAPLALCLLVTAAGSPLAAQSTPAQTAPPAYDTFCSQTRQEKQAMFKTIPIDQRAALARTQLERFRDANAARLSAEQKALIQEWITIGVAAQLTRPRTPEMEATLAALGPRIEAAFTRDDQRVMDEYGPCIPKVK
jgi:hypothetical protein